MSMALDREIGELSVRNNLGASLAFEFEGRSYVRMEDVGTHMTGERDVDLYYEVEGDRFFGDVMEGDVWRDLTDDEVRAYVAEWGLREAVNGVYGAKAAQRSRFSASSRPATKREPLEKRLGRATEGSRRCASSEESRRGVELSERSHGEGPTR